MSKKIANGTTVPTASDSFKYTEHIKRLALTLGCVPKVANKDEAKQMVKTLQSDPAFIGNFAWIIYVSADDTLYLHDGENLREA